MARVVLSDASPFIALAIVGGLGWLPTLFGEVWIPESVHREVLPGLGAHGEAEIKAAIKQKCVRVWRRAIRVPAIVLTDLDEGETDCLHIALLSVGGGAGAAHVLIDERAGRAVAHEGGVQVAGTAAVIGLARKRGPTYSAKPCFENLHNSEFRISAAVIHAVLRDVGEA